VGDEIMSNITLIINTVALWVIVVCQILENKNFNQIKKFNGDLVAKNTKLQSELTVLEHRTSSLEKRLSDSAITEAQQKQAEIKFELTRIDKTASNNREKIMALQERNKDQQKYNADFAKAIRRVGKK
jgi:hypothetical protein